jgi:hypothetical protein
MSPDNSIKPFIFYSDKLNFKTVMGKKGKEYWIEGYISTGDLDLVNDIVTKRCMDSMLAQFDMRSIKLDFEHEAFRGETEIDAERAKTRLPLGKAMNKDKDSKGVKVAWKLNQNWKKFNDKGEIVMTFEELWSNVEEGYYDAYSIAYVPTKTAMIERDGEQIRLLDDVNLLNVALTGNPINPGASMTSVMKKSLEFLKDKEKKDDWNDPADINLFEVKSDVDELKSELSNIKKTMGCKLMVDNKDETPEADAQTPEGNEQPDKGGEGQQPNANAAAPEGDAGEAEGVSAAAEPEGKSIVDLKSRIDKIEKDLKAVKKENADLKAIVEKAQQKAKGAENSEQKGQGQEEPKMVGPLDMV